MTYSDFQTAHTRWSPQLTALAKRAAPFELAADEEDIDDYLGKWSDGHSRGGFYVADLTFETDEVHVTYQLWNSSGDERGYLLRVPPQALDADDAWRQCVVYALARGEDWAALAAEDLDVLL